MLVESVLGLPVDSFPVIAIAVLLLAAVRGTRLLLLLCASTHGV